MSDQLSFDYVVLGAGSGGLSSARRAASYGASVAVIENFRIGGTCVNLGCVPKKMMFYASEFLHRINQVSPYYSIHSENKRIKAEFNWEEFVENRNSSLLRLNKIFHSHLEKSGVSFFDSSAKLSSSNGEHFVELDDKRILKAKHILIATGSSAVLPTPLAPPSDDIKSVNTKGIDGAITSDAVFVEMKKRPGKVVIVGAGYIGVELGCALKCLGVEVVLVVRKNILTGFDEMIQKAVEENMRNLGIEVMKGAAVSNYKKEEKVVEISLGKEKEDIEVKDVDYLLYAIGRKPNLRFLGDLEEGVKEKIIQKGKIEVDNFQAKDLGKNVWAVGDVTGDTMLTPYAIKCGRFLADRLFRDKVTEAEEIKFPGIEFVPTVVFSSPPAGTVGLTENEAKEKYKEVIVKTEGFDGLFYDVPKMAGIDRKHIQGSKMKVVVDKESDRVVGIHLVGHFADEALQGFALSMVGGIKYKDFWKCLAIHPTTAEDVVLI